MDWTTATTKYNQFVWIPVENEETYQRNFSYTSGFCNIENTFTDIGYLPADIQPEVNEVTNNEIAERKAVLKYNGFYIARYETGNENSKPVSKQNAIVYVEKSQTEFKTIGKILYGDSSAYVKSAMCSGIQWDMVMRFVNGKEDGNGNVYDVRTANLTRHTGNKTEKTGKNLADKVQNIYDLEGNCLEFVAEKNNTSSPFIFRGGNYSYSQGIISSHRSSSDENASDDKTFRLVLYIR